MNKDRIMAYIDNQSEIKKCVETQFPFFIAHEYHRFYELLEKGQLFGAFFEMKDVLEVLLKFPILVGTAYIESKREPMGMICAKSCRRMRRQNRFIRY